MSKRTKYFGNWRNAIQTFPMAHVLLVFLTSVAFLVINNLLPDEISWEMMLSGIFSLILSLYGPVLALHHERGTEKKLKLINRGLQIIAPILGGIYYFLLSEPTSYARGLQIGGIILLTIGGIGLLISRILKDREHTTWYSWTSIFQSLAFGILAGLIVRGGLSGALASIEALFDIDFSSWDWYQHFGVFSMILLAGSFVLNHYTYELSQLSNDKKSDIEIGDSRVRKVFGTYIFLPLALIYLAIFLGYGAKILITGVWPKGIIVRLGTGFFAWGILTIYATYPEKARFFEILRKIFFVSFVLIAMMMTSAIYQRIAQYGITINRFFICAFIGAIVLFSIFAFFFPAKRFRLFASIFFVIALLSLYGPLSAKNIAFSCQKSELITLLSQENITLPLKENSLSSLSADNIERIVALISKIIYDYEEKEWKQWLLTGGEGIERYKIDSYLGIPSYNTYNKKGRKAEYFNLWANNLGSGLDIQGYNRIYDLDDLDYHKSNKEKNQFIFVLDDQEIILDLNTYPEAIYKASQKEERNPFIIPLENKKFILTSIGGEKSDDSIKINDVYGYLLVK